jgi:hypothetical protein
VDRCPCLASSRGEPSPCLSLEEGQRSAQDLLQAQGVGPDGQIRVLTSVLKPLNELAPPGYIGLSGAALTSNLLGDIEVDEQVRLGDALPHRGYRGVLLGHLASVVASFSKGLDKRRLA